MFRRVANNFLSNDEGAEIHGISMMQFSYHEGDRAIIIGREAAVGDMGEPVCISNPSGSSNFAWGLPLFKGSVHCG